MMNKYERIEITILKMTTTNLWNLTNLRNANGNKRGDEFQ